MKRLSLLLLFLELAVPFCRGASTATRLLLSSESAKPGETIWAGIELKSPPHWHTYWRFPGDLGIATTVAWTLPPGVKAGDTLWPIPEKTATKAGDKTYYTYTYDDPVVLLAPLRLDASLPPGPLQLSASLTWLECEDQGQCVQGKSEISAALLIGPQDKPSPDAPMLEQWRQRLPRADTVRATAQWDAISPGDTRAVIIDWTGGKPPADFFPRENQAAGLQAATETLPAEPGRVRLRKIVKKSDGPWPERLAGILVGAGDSSHPAAFEVDLPLAKPVRAAAPAPGTTSPALMLLFAFLGGLILNVMPCVLPVIALKVLGFVSQSKESPRRVRRLGLVYGAGVLVSFLVLAAFAIGVQKTGQLASWGDLFRNPQFQVIMTILMTLIALNLFGVFEITLGAGVMGSAARLASRPGYHGAFFNGVLATVLATPCTAPFLGAALAFAFTQSAAVTLLVFLAAGAGLAFPFILICWNPRLLSALPKPGAWMEKFKVAMGFPMLFTALWLMWVSARSQEDMLWLGLFLVSLALAAWIWGEFVQRSTRRRGVAMLICLLVLASAYAVILEGQLQWRLPANAARTGIDWKVWSPDAVAQARQAGHPVLVDFTAKSCLTCQVNRTTSLEIARTRAKLKAINAVAFEADFTLEDPQIARELRRYHSPGVPLVLVYSTNLAQDPQVLPTALTPAIVLAALDQAAR